MRVVIACYLGIFLSSSVIVKKPDFYYITDKTNVKHNVEPDINQPKKWLLAIDGIPLLLGWGGVDVRVEYLLFTHRNNVGHVISINPFRNIIRTPKPTFIRYGCEIGYFVQFVNDSVVNRLNVGVGLLIYKQREKQDKASEWGYGVSIGYIWYNQPKEWIEVGLGGGLVLAQGKEYAGLPGWLGPLYPRIFLMISYPF